MISFTKMHGLGNDFVVLDARSGGIPLDRDQVRAMADRRRGIGCDQLIVVEPPRLTGATAYLHILNADGSESAACGNGTRCVAATLMEELGESEITLETAAGLLDATVADSGQITVNMGSALLDWREIPLAEECDTLHVGLDVGGLHDPVAVNVGNPHCVFFVDDVNAVDLERLGPGSRAGPDFPRAHQRGGCGNTRRRTSPYARVGARRGHYTCLRLWRLCERCRRAPPQTRRPQGRRPP